LGFKKQIAAALAKANRSGMAFDLNKELIAIANHGKMSEA
jgi:hypothetical protein